MQPSFSHTCAVRTPANDVDCNSKGADGVSESDGRSGSDDLGDVSSVDDDQSDEDGNEGADDGGVEPEQRRRKKRKAKRLRICCVCVLTPQIPCPLRSAACRCRHGIVCPVPEFFNFGQRFSFLKHKSNALYSIVKREIRAVSN